jgi:methylthioribose-1-phosphate isomerase
MENNARMKHRSVQWEGGLDGCMRIIDQTLLPSELRLLDLHSSGEAFDAIRQLKVRGAPAIGIAGAMGLVLALRGSRAGTAEEFRNEARGAADFLASARPTAVNLRWALERLMRIATDRQSLPVEEIKHLLLREAISIRDEDARMCRAIGEYGATLLKDGDGVLTHCNAGALATSEYGTALAAIFVAHEQGKRVSVFVDETRPLLQGARLTAWELMQEGIDATLICDNMAGQVMKEGRVRRVLVGADRIAANGDTANKIGTYSLAVLAHEHGIPFCVAAPSSTFDLSIPDGSRIPIEQRAAEEVVAGFGRRTAPEGIKVYNPAFDVTPARYIDSIITERGIIRPPSFDTIRRGLGA